VRLFTRRGLDWTDRYPFIAAAVATLSCRSCLIDGEVGEDGIPRTVAIRRSIEREEISPNRLVGILRTDRSIRRCWYVCQSCNLHWLGTVRKKYTSIKNTAHGILSSPNWES
jgi:hypothetical protein